jgi:outer membrane protein assembly factor BamB
MRILKGGNPMRLSNGRGFAVLVVLLVASGVYAADWPQFRGPNRDGLCGEAGLLTQWPEGGPQELWSFDELGHGFASVAIVDGVVYTTGMEDKQGWLYALDLEGNLKYKVNYGPEWAGSHPGTHTTPTIDKDRLYLMSGQGRISCHDITTGKCLWFKDTLNTFKGKNIRWGIAECILIHGEKVICTPGGQDATVVALDKMSGKTIWTTKGLSERSAYCSPCVIERGSKLILLTMVEKSIVGIDIQTGKLLWRVGHEVSYDISAVTPVYVDGVITVSNGYKHGSLGFELAPDGMSVTRKWAQKSLDVHHGGMLLIDGNVHGANGREWQCLDPKTGTLKYAGKLTGKGSAIYAQGMLYCYGEKGQLGLARVDPTGYELVSSFKITKGEKQHWAHPVISDGRLYIRHGEILMCFDIKAK